MSRRVVAIIQARYGSTRLPGKILLPLGGDTVLASVVARARASSKIDDVVVATTTSTKDDAVAAEGQRLAAMVFRGSEDDVLSRYHDAAVAARADVVVRITSDCPLLDPSVTDSVIERFLDGQERCDYASNTIVRSFPRGLDVEVCAFEALTKAARSARRAEEREHVTLFFHNNADRFALCSVVNDRDLSAHRWTLDTPEDYRFFQRVFNEMPIRPPEIPRFDAVVRFLESHPDIRAINAGVQQKAVTT